MVLVIPQATVGSALIKPIDKGWVKGLALSSMYEQTKMQLDQIREQLELLAQQAKIIYNRVQYLESVYRAMVGFKPLVGHTYHLYKKKKKGKEVLSIIGPKEWGKGMPYVFQASMRLLSDHTWEVV